MAREMGVKIIACAMSMDVMGIAKEELVDGIGLGGVATFLGEAARSRVSLYLSRLYSIAPRQSSPFARTRPPPFPPGRKAGWARLPAPAPPALCEVRGEVRTLCTNVAPAYQRPLPHTQNSCILVYLPEEASSTWDERTSRSMKRLLRKPSA